VTVTSEELTASSVSGSGIPATPPGRHRHSLFEGTLPYLFILPTFILIGLIIVYPLLQAIYSEPAGCAIHQATG
jgi:hypothetical protein